MKTFLIATVLSFGAGAGTATVTLKAQTPAPLSIASIEPAKFQTQRVTHRTPEETNRCFEIVGGEQYCH